jgi:hypothetical protein
VSTRSNVTPAAGLPPVRDHALYGLRLRSEHVFANHVPLADPAPACEQHVDRETLPFHYVVEAPLAAGWETSAPTYRSTTLIDEETSFLYVVQHDGCTVFRFSEVVDFFIFPDRILCRVIDTAYAYMIELHLLGFVLSAWFEARGVAAIHGAGVTLGDEAIGFLSTNKGGKSSLAASFMQAGHALLSDDILPIESHEGVVTARPSYPQMRMWPDQARHFWGSVEDLETVHPHLDKRRIPVGDGGFGTFCDERRRLTCLYVPERRDGGGIEITGLSFAESVFALTRYAFLATIMEHVDRDRSRFALLSRIALAVPVRRVVYPSGVERLPEVVAAITEDATLVVAGRAEVRDASP